MNELGVSVVIPTLNRDGFLYDAVMDILNQSYTKFEIIIVDQSDSINREIQDLVSTHSNKIRYYHNVGFKGLPQARNFGWQNAKYELILYIDDDIRTNKNLIKNHVVCYENPNVVLVAGGIDEKNRGLDDKEPTGSFNPWTCTPHRGFASKNDQTVTHVPGGNFSVLKKVIKKVNGIDETLNIGAALYEETDFSLRVKNLNKITVFKANARLLHLVADTGGCRVINNIPKYMYGLAHNRSIVISRHLKFHHKFTAYIRLLLLGLSYSRSAKSFKPMITTLKGIKAGRTAGQKPVLCGQYKRKNN